ncbi:GNAT family N-acetyltransferase [Chloroflexia bacterium SDU3-3]|nr:GNAT family N-acetyltransferase [Chloroflexia bacterium SDU3-3]
MLQGTRVTLRPAEQEDLKALHAMRSNVDLVQLGNGCWEPEPLARWQMFFDKSLEGQPSAWMVIEVAGTVIGSCTLHHSQRRDGSTQLGIGIYHPQYVGQGYGREAIGLLLDWAFYDQGWRRVWLEAFALNERALRLYRRLGFVEEGRLRQHTFFRGQYIDIIHMGLLREEWDQARNHEIRSAASECRAP